MSSCLTASCGDACRTHTVIIITAYFVDFRRISFNVCHITKEILALLTAAAAAVVSTVPRTAHLARQVTTICNRSAGHTHAQDTFAIRVGVFAWALILVRRANQAGDVAFSIGIKGVAVHTHRNELSTSVHDVSTSGRNIYFTNRIEYLVWAF